MDAVRSPLERSVELSRLAGYPTFIWGPMVRSWEETIYVHIYVYIRMSTIPGEGTQEAHW
jgi:hypothetical protein